MRVKLAYGREGLWIELPDDNVTVVEPEFVPGLTDEKVALTEALRHPMGTPPLRELVKPDDTVAVVFSDITRPQPRKEMLSALLEEISHVDRDNIVLINGLGTHRANSPEELIQMLGEEIVRDYRILQHNAWDRARTANLGQTSFGHEACVNADYLGANVRILTGFIEPHFFAGFSGGPKAVLPGIASERSILENHAAQMIEHPCATWGVTEGNPIWEEMREVALMTSPTFLLNVSLNREKQITGIYAGDLLAAHAAGTDFVRSRAMVPISEPFDIVITSNSGYPLDLNLYQAVKGMSAAVQIVKPGGSIIMAAECWDGLPDHGEYASLLRDASTPHELLHMIHSFEYVHQDQWEAQIQAQIQLKADVYVKSSYLDETTLRNAMVKACASIEETIETLLHQHGHDATICVLPEGPMTIPYIAQDR